MAKEVDKQVTLVLGPNKKITVNKQGLQEYLQEQLAKDPSLSSESNRQALAEWEALGGKLSDIFNFLTGNTEKTLGPGNFATEYNNYKNQYNDLAQQTKKLQAEVVGTPVEDRKTSEFKRKESAFLKAKADLAVVATKRDNAKAKWDASKSASKPVEQNQLAFDEAKRKADTAVSKLNNAKYSDKSAEEIKKLEADVAAAKAAQDAAQAKLKSSKDVYSSQKESGFSAKGTVGAERTIGQSGMPAAPGAKVTMVTGKPVVSKPQIPAGGPSGTAVPSGGVPSGGGTSGGGVTKGKAVGPGAESGGKGITATKSIDEIFKLAAQEYAGIDEIFKTNPELANLMTAAVNGQWESSKFLNALTNTDWYNTNSKNLQAIGFAKRKRDDLAARGLDTSKTEYEIAVKNVKDLLAADALQQGAVFDDAQLQKTAESLYDAGQGNNSVALRKSVASQIKYDPTLTKGAAATSLKDLRDTALNNGLNFDKTFAVNAQSWLAKIAEGESIETFKNLIRNTAKVGMPENIQAMMDSGVDLNTIIDPYKRVMAQTLEINPETIQLTDPSLTTAFKDKSSNLFDFQRSLRKDNRWQYTSQAKQEVSDIANKVLSDFGFVG